MSSTGTVNPFFTPSQISGCQLWLDAADRNSVVVSGLNVTQWKDKSGNGRDASTVGTITNLGRIGGIPAMQYPGTAPNYFIGPLPNSGATLTAFSVFLMNSTSYIVARILSLAQAGGFDYNSTLHTAAIQRNVNTSFVSYRNNANLGSVTPVFGAAVQVCTLFNGTTNTFYSNGTQGTSVASSGNFGYTQYEVGGSFGEENLVPLSGLVGEVIVYHSAVTTAQRQQIEGYLAWKWGLQANLPATHPYKTSPIPPLLNPPIGFPLAVQSTQPFTWFPNQVSGLQVWFDAADSSTFSFSSGSNIQGWRDKSSNKYLVSQANVSLQPTLASSAQNALPGVQLTTAAYLSTAGSNMPNFTIGSATSVFIAARNASTNTSWNIVNTIWFTGVSNGTARYHFSFNQGATAGTTLYVNNALVGQVTSNATPPNSNAMLGFTASGSSASIHTNGSVNTYAGVTLPNANNATDFIFGDARNNIASSNVMIFEMVGYNRQVTTAEREQIEGYFAWKWGLQSLLPSSQPYKGIPPFSPALAFPARAIGIGTTWQPTQLSGLSLWLDAADRNSLVLSGSNVSQWNDKSGNGYNASQGTLANQPIFSNSTIVFRSANQNWMNLNQTYGNLFLNNSPFTVFIVAFGSGQAFLVGQAMITAQNLFLGYGLIDNYNSPNYLTGSPPVAASLNSINEYEYSGSGASMYQNGSSFASRTGVLSLTSFTGPQIGRRYSGASVVYHDQTFREIITYFRVLTTAQRQSVEGYLAWKWGLVANLPATHPFKRWPPSP